MSNNSGTPKQLTTSIRTLDALLAEVKHRVSMQMLVDKLDGLNLSPRGNDLVGECPTGHPSSSGTCFSIHIQDNFFKCFHAGCTAKGDVVELVRITQKLTFRKAIFWLADKFGIAHAVPQRESWGADESAADRTERLRREINAKLYDALVKYGRQLLFEQIGQTALTYLISDRKYDPAVLEHAEFFYLPPARDSKAFLRQEYPDHEAEINALSLNGYFGDNFRLAIPYRDLHGNITGLLKRSTSPTGETITTADGNMHRHVRWDSTKGLSKHDLFGLHAAKGQKTLIIVEGYPDAMYFSAAGMQNIVAIGQGNIGKSHIEGLVRQGVKRVILAFDNDPAKADGSRPGSENTRTAIEQILTNSPIDVFVIDPVLYGTHKDPDEYVRANGLDAFQKLADQAMSASRWIVGQISAGIDEKSDQQRKDALDEALQFGALLNRDIDREELAELLSKALSRSKSSVLHALKAHTRVPTSKTRAQQPTSVDFTSQPIYPFVESGTSSYAYYEYTKDRVHLNVSKEILVQVLGDAGLTVPEQLPVLELVFDVHQNERIDLEKKSFNLFSPTEFLLLKKTPDVIDLVKECPSIQLLFQNLIPDANARERYINWLAGILQTRRKQGTAWVFMGGQGAGKGIHLNHVLKPLFGRCAKRCAGPSAPTSRVRSSRIRCSAPSWRSSTPGCSTICSTHANSVIPPSGSTSAWSQNTGTPAAHRQSADMFGMQRCVSGVAPARSSSPWSRSWVGRRRWTGGRPTR
jgi:DNA primase catalytic core